MITWVLGSLGSEASESKSSQVSSIDMALALGARSYKFESRQYHALLKIESVLEIPLDKELTVNFLVETCTKLVELIAAAMVKYGLKGLQPPLCLQQSLFNGFSWFGLS